MDVGVMEARPPYVTFELQPVEDREESLKQGRYVTKDMPFVIITPAGSKDRIPKPAQEWLDNIALQARQKLYNPQWVQVYKDAFKMWLEGEEIPENGTPVKNWSIPSPAQVKALIEQNLRTVEDVAAMNEECITRLGMGGRGLKEHAINFLKAAEGPGKQGAAMAALEATNRQQAELITRLTDSLQQMEAKVDSLLRTPVESTLPAGFGAYQTQTEAHGTPDIGDMFSTKLDAELSEAGASTQT